MSRGPVKTPKLCRMTEDPFDAVIRNPDPLSQARQASELITLYQQRGHELARVRRRAIEQAAANLDLTYSEIASRIGVSKGRISQIRHSSPPPDRALFGVGPVWIYSGHTQGRNPAPALPLVESMLHEKSLATSVRAVDAGGELTPRAESLIVGGELPKNVYEEYIKDDPQFLVKPRRGGRWSFGARGIGLWQSPEALAKGRARGLILRASSDDRSPIILLGDDGRGQSAAAAFLRDNSETIYENAGSVGYFSILVSASISGTQVSGPLPMTPLFLSGRIHDFEVNSASARP